MIPPTHQRGSSVHGLVVFGAQPVTCTFAQLTYPFIRSGSKRCFLFYRLENKTAREWGGGGEEGGKGEREGGQDNRLNKFWFIRSAGSLLS